jgi:HEAT repeat protein
MTEDPAELAQGLRSPDVDTAALALGELVDSGAPSVPALIDALGDADPAVRKRAAEGLGMIGDPSSADALFQAVGDADERVRANAATALARLGDPRALEALVRTLDDAPDPLHADLTLSAYTLMSLGPDALPAMADVLESGSEPARRRAAFILMKIASDRFDEDTGNRWRRLHGVVASYDPNADRSERADAARAVRAWAEDR